MRFKSVFIVFNIVIVFSFLFIFLVPLLLLGGEYFSIFVGRNWIAAVLFAATLGAVNVYFGRNWRLFTLLEKEDWPHLLEHLEKRLRSRGGPRQSHARMAVNAYLITSNVDAILDLEARIRARKPKMLRRLAGPFGLAHLLRGDAEQSVRYFGGMLRQPGVKGKDWLRWNYAFSLMQQERMDEAAEEYVGLLDGRPEPLLEALALYMLDVCAKDELRARVDSSREAFVERIDPPRWRRVVQRSRGSMEAMVLSRLIRDAGSWLYADQSTGH